MSKKVVILISLMSVIWVIPASAQDSKLNFNAGGGISTPLNPTGQYAGVSGNVNFGAGYNIDKNNSVMGEFLWSGLPPNLFTLHPIDAPFGKINLYSLTANYRYKVDRIHGSRFGAYIIGGGGWYYRYSQIDKNFIVPGGTVCDPVYDWWGFVCAPTNTVFTQTLASKGNNAGGLNGGVGFTVGFNDSGWKFYIESRYHYAWHNRIPTVLIPVTFGLRFN